MPTETRRICFSNAEVADAIEHFAKATKFPMPPGKIAECKIDAHGPLMAALTVRHMAEGSSRIARFDKNTIAAALIRFCIEKKIPIPRSAEKSVEAQGDGVALILRVGGTAQGAAA